MPTLGQEAAGDLQTATFDLRKKLRQLPPTAERERAVTALEKATPHLTTKQTLTFIRTLSALLRAITGEPASSLRREVHARGRAARERLAADNEILDSEAMRSALGITRQALNKALHAHRIFALTMDSGANYYPAFYADPKLDRGAVERVSKRLGALSGWSKWQFFTTPRTSLRGLTPLQALAKGKLRDVVAAADGFAER